MEPDKTSYIKEYQQNWSSEYSSIESIILSQPNVYANMSWHFDKILSRATKAPFMASAASSPS